MKKPREIAIEALINIEQGSYSHIVLNKVLTPVIPQKDRGLITELIYGSTQYRLRLDYIISKFSKIRVMDMSPIVRNALRSGVYQVFFLDRVPNFAAVNETVNIVKRHHGQRTANFVNGVMRNICRCEGKISYPDPYITPEKYLSIFYSFPLWMVNRWSRLYGVDVTKKLCCSLNERPKMCIRINSLKTYKEDLEQILTDEGIIYSDGKLLKEALYVDGVMQLKGLKSFKRGLYQPQDESSMLVSVISGVRPGDVVLDATAAPGGKSSHMAQIMQNKGKIIAWDIHPQRVRLIMETCERLGVTIVDAIKQDATDERVHEFNSYDKVILDAPCSGLGVIRRKPDIKWTKSKEDIHLLRRQQKKLINTISKYVRVGGILIYSVCSMDPSEGEEVIKEFLDDHPEYTPDDIRPLLPKALLDEGKGSKGFISLLPHLYGVDGFFISRLRKTSP